MPDNLNYSRVVPALTQVLCKVNKLLAENERKQLKQIENELYFSSVLILNASEIHSSLYNGLMSCIETAVKNRVLVYVYNLPGAGLSESTNKYLMQLCSLTSGYLFTPKKDDQTKEPTMATISPFDIMNYLSILMLTQGDMIANPS